MGVQVQRSERRYRHLGAAEERGQDRVLGLERSEVVGGAAGEQDTQHDTGHRDGEEPEVRPEPPQP
jgi:hypothetical protein